MRRQASPPGPASLSRRRVLALGPACLAAALTGCAAAEPAAPSPGPAASRTPSQTTSAPGPDTEATKSPAAPPTDGPTPRVLISAKRVPIGGGTVVSGILVVQPFAGLFKAFDARCPHLAAVVSPPKNGVITCGAHGSQFVDIDGSLLRGPAPRGLKEIPITVEDGRIVVE